MEEAKGRARRRGRIVERRGWRREREREKERKRILLHARRGGGNSFNFYRVRVYRRIVYVRMSCIPDER